HRLLHFGLADGIGSYARQLWKALQREYRNQRALKTLLHDFQPDIVYIWNTKHVCISLVFLVQRAGLPIVFHFGDTWFAIWKRDFWYRFWNNQNGRFLTRWLKYLTQPFVNWWLLVPTGSIKFRNSQFVSTFLHGKFNELLPETSHQVVINWGINLADFPYCPSETTDICRLLFIGRIAAQKGLHVLVNALRLLKERPDAPRVELTVVGERTEPFATEIDTLIAQHQLPVKFIGTVTRSEIPLTYAQHDVFMFSAIGDEAYGLVLLEAQASGLVIIGTGAGGSADILQDEVNALIYEAENAADCARVIFRVCRDFELRERLRKNGRQNVESRFQLANTIDRVEADLSAVLQDSSS
ncbi:MAG: glycosyltransferase family 4 protein, partial [Anaerolinea sp.]|nr:glycosyltransferase family 4 protein [Anaerolinea sp.]